MFFFFHSFFLQIEKYHKKENAEKRKKTMKKYIELQMVWQSWIFTTNTNGSNLFFISSHSTMKFGSIWMKDNTVIQWKQSTFSLMEKWPWSSLFLSQLNHFFLQSSVDVWIHRCSSWQDFFVEIPFCCLMNSIPMYNASGDQNLSFPPKITCPSDNASFVSNPLDLEDFWIFHWIPLKIEIFSPWSVWQSLFPPKSLSNCLWDLFLQNRVWGLHEDVNIHHW